MSDTPEHPVNQHQFTPLPGDFQPSDDPQFNAALERIIGCTEDDPDLTLENLTTAERARLVLRFVIYANDEDTTAESLPGVEYYVEPSTMHNAPNSKRRSYDIGINLLIGRTIGYGLMAAQPVIRTIGMAQHERVPKLGLTVKEAEAYARDLHTGNAVGLFTDPNDKLIERYKLATTFEVPTTAADEARQVADISVIAANAVRRHPERELVHVGVALPAFHEAIASEIILKGLLPTLSLHHLRPSPEEYLHSANQIAQRQAVIARGVPERIFLERALLSEYFKAGLLIVVKDKVKADYLARSLNEQMQDETIAPLLERADKAKGQKLRGLNLRRVPERTRRADKVMEAMLDVPDMVSALGRLFPDAK